MQCVLIHKEYSRRLTAFQCDVNCICMADTPVTKQELEELLGESQQVIIEAVDYKFQDIEKHLMRIEDSLDKTYGAILERHDSLLVKIARKLGLEEELEP